MITPMILIKEPLGYFSSTMSRTELKPGGGWPDAARSVDGAIVDHAEFTREGCIKMRSEVVIRSRERQAHEYQKSRALVWPTLRRLDIDSFEVTRRSACFAWV